MRVFLTGGTGYVGGAALRALLDAGHEVTALVRRDGPLPEAGAGELEGWRAEVERTVLAAETSGAVIRLSFVYGGSGGYLWDMLAPGPEGTVRYALPGTARWPFVHVDDLAALYLRVVEARATGVFHGAAGDPVPVADVARWVGDLVGAEPEGLPPEEAVRTLPHVGPLMLRDVDPETHRSRELEWHPRHTDFPREVEAAYRALKV